MSSTTQVQKIQHFVESMPATQSLGIEILELSEDRVLLAMANRPELTFNGTVIQGGIVATLADYAAVMACGTTQPNGWLMATTGATTHNIAPADGQRLLATGQVIKRGQRHAIARGDVFNNNLDGPLVLTGLFTATGVPPQQP